MINVKIVATMGPSLATEEKVAKAIEAGVNVFRLNFSHGKTADHVKNAQLIRTVAERMGVWVGLMADLQGPKIRIGMFEQPGGVELKEGQIFDLSNTTNLGTTEFVGLEYKALFDEAFVGDILVLDDGKLRLSVEGKEKGLIRTRVLNNAKLTNHKGINRLGGGLSAPAITPKDIEDLITACQIKVDFVALSFVKNEADVALARLLMSQSDHKAWVVSKIERKEAIDNLESIINASDGIMVARGDLALEVGEVAVPALQKQMIRMARAANRFSITATQMLESMITASTPTRAEVSDVANAVLDGTDAVMLSAESASGAYPIEAISFMKKISAGAWGSHTDASIYQQNVALESKLPARTDQLIAHAALSLLKTGQVAKVIALTSTGYAPLWLSRQFTNNKIIAICHSTAALGRCAMMRDVTAILEELPKGALFEQVLERMRTRLLREGLVKKGERVVFTFGEPMGSVGGTDALRIIEI